MVQGKVEICGVNTAKLPLLKAADKDAYLRRSAKEIPLPARAILREIYVWS